MTVRLKLASLGSALSLAVLTACTSTSSVDITDTAVLTNSAIESRLVSDYELIKQVSTQIDVSNIYDESMQPANKKEKCLLPFMVSEGEETKLYWDGACKNGHAVGLGRAVRAIAGKKVAESLVELDPKDHNSLVTYLRYDLTRNESEIGYSILTLKDEKFQGYSATLGINDLEWNEGTYEFTYRYEDTPNFVSYTKIVNLLTAEVSSIIAYPNYSHDLLNAHDNVLSKINQTYRLLEGRTMMGLSYIWLKDGRLIMRDNATGKESQLSSHPEALEQYVSAINDKVSAKYAIVDSQIDQGFAKVEEYSNKKCKRPSAFFKGDEVNFICDYLTNLTTAYEQLSEAKELREHEVETKTQSKADDIKVIEDELENVKAEAQKYK